MPLADKHDRYAVPNPDGTTTYMVRALSDAQVSRMIASALAVVDELRPGKDLRQAVFAAALGLTGQMAQPQDAGSVVSPVPAAALGNLKDRGRHN